jgi:hypothetical protein
MVGINLNRNWLIVVHLNSNFVNLRYSDHLSICYVPDKMIMHPGIIMEEVDKQLELGDPTTIDEGINKILVHHGIVIKIADLIDLDLCFLNFFT